MSVQRPRRSMVYRLGTDAASYGDGRSVAADALLFDLEDSVAPVEKPTARTRLLDALAAGGFNGQERIVRINALETLWGADDIAVLARAPVDGIMMAKAESPEQMRAANAALSHYGAPPTLGLWAMIETPRGVLAAAEIAGSTPRMAGLAIGLGDLSRGMGSFRRAAPFRFPVLAALSTIVLAARAHGLAAIDSSFRDAGDPDGFRAACIESRELGYDGKAISNPALAPIADETFAPNEDEIAWASKVLAAVAKARAGTQPVVDGQLIEPGYFDVARSVAAAASWPRRKR
jgi:citrate lyase subunit beta / citryl-CoA lyase